jgi:hypothetical protein
MKNETFDAIYNAAGMLRREAENACSEINPDKVHHLVSEQRKLATLAYKLEKMYGRD